MTPGEIIRVNGYLLLGLAQATVTHTVDLTEGQILMRNIEHSLDHWMSLYPIGRLHQTPMDVIEVSGYCLLHLSVHLLTNQLGDLLIHIHTELL